MHNKYSYVYRSNFQLLCCTIVSFIVSNHQYDIHIIDIIQYIPSILGISYLRNIFGKVSDNSTLVPDIIVSILCKLQYDRLQWIIIFSVVT